MKHPHRNNVFDEYREWCRIRNYDKTHAYKWLNYMSEHGFDVKTPVLYQVNVCMFKNTQLIKEFGKTAIKLLHTFNGEHLERLDQTVITYMLNTLFAKIKVFTFTQDIYMRSKCLSFHCKHPRT